MKNAPELRSQLLAWYDHAKRDLPWRGVKDPYAILVSEIMLQQTRVDTAIEYYKKFLKHFPTPKALASASIDSVLAVWAGLGYYRRARMLQSAARDIVEKHGGRVPADLELLRSLPGVGAYTAGAVASIAYNIPAAAVDGNVIRVLSRIVAFAGDPFTGVGRAKIDQLAFELAKNDGRAGDWTQSLMELGATVCLPTNPLCLICPVGAHCAARSRGLVEKIPPRKRRRATEAVQHTAAVVADGERYLFVKRGEEMINAGLYEFPTMEITDGAEPTSALGAFVKERTGVAIHVEATVARVRHTITFRRIDVDARGAWPAGGHPSGGALWLTPGDVARRGVTAATRKVINAIAKNTKATNPKSKKTKLNNKNSR